MFSTVTGKIQNLNLNANVTFSGTASNMQVGLLCGTLRGTVESCNVSGNINSTVQAGNGGGTSAGLVVGECAGGTIKYCNAIGNVTGVGYVGGIVGEMTSYTNISELVWDKRPTVLGCSFVGSVTANNPKDTSTVYEGSFAGGICGFANSGATINLCYVNADITSGKQTNGVASTNGAGLIVANGSPTVTNNYAEGTVNGQPIGAGNITNSAGNTNHNYYPGGSTQNGGTTMTSQQIADSLNKAAAGDTNIHFSPVGDGNVIFGKVSTESVCETPTNLTITKNDDGTYTASWEVVAVDEEAPSEFVWTLKREEVVLNVEWSDLVLEQNVWSISTESSLDASLNAYTFYVKSKCAENLFSEEVSIPFYVDCPTPTNLTASNITDNGFKISWTANVDCQLTINGNTETILAGNPMEKTITGLDPDTTYTAIVKAKCGNEYVEQASINITTAKLAKPTGLAVSPIWETDSGKITVTWDTIPGLTYVIEGEEGTQTSGFEKSGLANGNYTLKLKAIKGNKESDWVSMPYTVSYPEAPKNPNVTYTLTDTTFTVTINWEQGVTTATGWTVENDSISKPYELFEQIPGDAFDVEIQEISNLGTSGILVVPIQVPCLPASDAESITVTQTTAIFTFASANSKRKLYIGPNKYSVEGTSIEISGLTSGTTYSYEIREYCNEETDTYSSVSGAFATVGCFAVKNLSVSNIGVTNATISWESQSTLADLNYQITVNGETQPEQTDKTITLTGLTSATEYTIVVKEQCGEGWGEERTITFTTESSNYVTAKDGNFNFSDTWQGGKVPGGNIGTITIQQGHTVTLSHALVLKNDCKIINYGVLKITSQGELINTTGNNVGGIIEVETQPKTMNQWTFIGAPFENGYKLETILPVSGSDISVSKYDYADTNWSDSWATIETEMEAGEGYFAWPFYGGVVTYTTYGDVCKWNSTTQTYEVFPYDSTKTPATNLNNDSIKITKTINEKNGRWMALANPYPAKLDIEAFVNGNKVGNNYTIQGKVIYRLNKPNNNGVQTYTFVESGDIEMTEGFFVNLDLDYSSVTFSKTQLTNYPTTEAKSQVAPRKFVELSLVKGNHKSKLYFAHNQEAEQGYDIFDANKLFALGEVAEPYFVTDGTALVKEEVKELPYYATMNVRSFADDTVSFVVENIPEGYYVYLIDNGERIKMYEQIGYLTQIAEGENEDRFKVLVTKTILEDSRAASNIEITNYNREITIESEVENLEIEVYNALGQKVFATKDYNFTLNEVPAGAYLVKAFSGKVRQTQKIVVE